VPNFIELLFAPWKLLELFERNPVDLPQAVTAAQAAKDGTTAVTTVSDGSLCAIQDLGGGQMINVCHVLGYDMPGFVFWASLCIFLLFIGASIGLLFQCFDLASVLDRLAHQLERLPKAKGNALTESQLESIRHVMAKEQLVAPVWSRFEETLIVSPDDDEVFSTQPIDTTFSRAALIEDNVQSALFSAIPGVLTGVGLLMTFVAILDGLSHVSVASNMDVKGIGGLINGLSGKFVSSIVAVTCAVLFVFVERIAYSRPAEAYRQLIHRMHERFPRRTMEHLLFQLLKGKSSTVRSARNG